MNTEEELRRKVNLLRDAAKKSKGVQLKWHDTRASVVEGLVSRADRRMADVIEHVWRNGGLFQEWSEHFDIELWTTAIEACGLDFDWYAYRHRQDRKSVVSGKSVSVRVDLGGGRSLKKKNKHIQTQTQKRI